MGLVAAATTGSAVAGIKIIGIRHASEFVSLADVLAHGLLHLMHRLLGVHEAAGDDIAKEFRTLTFEVGDLLIGQFDTLRLLVLEMFAAFAEGLILSFSGFVVHERLNALSYLTEFGLLHDGLAEFTSLLDN